MQLFSFWGVDPIIQPTILDMGDGVPFSANSGDPVLAGSTFGGWTIPQVIKALQLQGTLSTALPY